MPATASPRLALRRRPSPPHLRQLPSQLSRSHATTCFAAGPTPRSGSTTHCATLRYDVLPTPSLPRQASCRIRLNFSHIHSAGDIVLLRDKKDASHDGTLIKLEPSKITGTHRGSIKHVDIIGKQPRQIVQSSRGTSYRIHEPTLAEYVRLTPRLVTPVRSQCSNFSRIHFVFGQCAEIV